METEMRIEIKPGVGAGNIHVAIHNTISKGLLTNIAHGFGDSFYVAVRNAIDEYSKDLDIAREELTKMREFVDSVAGKN